MRSFCSVVSVMSWKEGKDPNPHRNTVFRGWAAGLDEVIERGKIRLHHNSPPPTVSLREKWGH